MVGRWRFSRYSVVSLGEHWSRLVLVILKITGVGDMTISAGSLFQYFIILSTRNIFLIREPSLLQENFFFFFSFLSYTPGTLKIIPFSFTAAFWRLSELTVLFNCHRSWTGAVEHSIYNCSQLYEMIFKLLFEIREILANKSSHVKSNLFSILSSKSGMER